jgi:hypothetical protein
LPENWFKQAKLAIVQGLAFHSPPNKVHNFPQKYPERFPYLLGRYFPPSQGTNILKFRTANRSVPWWIVFAALR